MNFKRKNNHINLDQLVSKLQKEDNRYAKLCKGIQITYSFFIPFYTIMTIRHYLDSGEMSDLIGGLLYVGGFLIIAIFLEIITKHTSMSITHYRPSKCLRMPHTDTSPFN